MNPHLQLTTGKAKAHSTLRNGPGNATLNPGTQGMATPTNAYGIDMNNGTMLSNQATDAQRLNQNQTQIQRNNYLVA